MINLRIPKHKQIETDTQRQQIWALLRYELLYISWAVMEVALIAPVALALLPWVRYWPIAPVAIWLVFLLLLPFNFVRLFDHLNIPFDRQQQLMIVGLILTAVLSVRGLFYAPASIFDFDWLRIAYSNFTTSRNSLWARDMVMFAVVGFTWWRGLVLVTREPNVDRLTPQIRWGLLYLAPLAIWLASSRLEWTIAPFLFVYVVAGLTAVALTRVDQAEQEQGAYMAIATPRWLIAILLSIGLIIVLSSSFAFGLGQLTLAHLAWGVVLWRPLRFIWIVITVTVLYLVFPLQGPLNRLLEWIVAFWNRAWEALLAEAELIETRAQPPDLQEVVDGLEQGTYVDVVNFRVVVFALLLLFLLAAIRFMQRRYRARRLAAVKTTVYQTQRQQVTERGAAGSLFDRLRQQWGGWRNGRTIRTIRRIYQQMSYAALLSGFPRGEAETPYEYIPSLEEVWPDHPADVRLITEAYVKIRYGMLPETKEEFEAILAAWRRLEATPPVSKQ